MSIARRLVALVALVVLALVATTALGGCGDEQSPFIDAIVPDRAAVGTEVDIVGERFDGPDRFVSFGGTQATVRFWKNDRVRVVVPNVTAGSVVVVVSVDGRHSAPFDFRADPR